MHEFKFDSGAKVRIYREKSKKIVAELFGGGGNFIKTATFHWQLDLYIFTMQESFLALQIGIGMVIIQYL